MARPRTISNEQILDCMSSCVVAHGPGVSLDEVSKQLGVTTPALLKRFGSRRALMIAALRLPTSPEWFAKVEAGPDARPFAEQLTDVLVMVWEFYCEHMPRMMALRASGIDLEEIYRDVEGTPTPLLAARVLARWIERCERSGHLALGGLSSDSVATMLLGAVQARFFFAHLAGLTRSTRTNRPYLESITTLFTRATVPAAHKTRSTKPARRRSTP